MILVGLHSTEAPNRLGVAYAAGRDYLMTEGCTNPTPALQHSLGTRMQRQQAVAASIVYAFGDLIKTKCGQNA
jgi:hypothetical protein